MFISWLRRHGDKKELRAYFVVPTKTEGTGGSGGGGGWREGRRRGGEGEIYSVQ